MEEDGRGLHPDWTIDYAGAEAFWCGGWSSIVEIDTSENAKFLDYTSDFDFIVFDPDHMDLPTSIFADPPLLVADSKQNYTIPSENQEIFSRLPIEIVDIVLCYLPTPSVWAIRLTSRLFASVPLTNNFWHSRFDFPHELCHVSTEILSSGKTNLPVDWKGLRERLLNPQLPEGRGWKNRRRIVELTRKFVLRILAQKDSRDDFQAPTPISTSSSFQVFSCGYQSTLTQESLNFDTTASGSGQRTLGFTFQSWEVNPTIVGIAYSGYAGSSVLGRSHDPDSPSVKLGLVYSEYAGSSVLGRSHDPDSPSVKLGLEEQLIGFIVGIAAEGLVGIKVIIGLTDSRDVLREESFGSFEGNVAFGRLLPITGSMVVGLRCGLSKASTDTLHVPLYLPYSREAKSLLSA